MRFFGLPSSSSSTNGRFKLSVSFVTFTVKSFWGKLLTVSATSPELPSLDSVSLTVLEDVLSTGALLDVFDDGWETDWEGVSDFSSVSTLFL